MKMVDHPMTKSLMAFSVSLLFISLISPERRRQETKCGTTTPQNKEDVIKAERDRHVKCGRYQESLRRVTHISCREKVATIALVV
ncbi:hypothetical protein F4679DRAFT_538323 [Xylaria curta]|nr:hypothetical protein F4679DRAFT_538323 [Xylaria curta]